jgi:tetratricopeptide (TPR) repeat protein
LDEYVEKYPNDPYILNQKALRTWHQGNLEEAERLYRRLAEISPNWVIAYNQLGYITMMQGRFTEAEEYFKSYRFIAPDQANPYDSLGELFITLGRWDEAEETLERALEIKPDFWAPYQHLALMKTFNGDIDGAREIIERAKAADIGDRMVFNMECELDYMAMRNEEAWQLVLDESESDCAIDFKKGVGFAVVTTHLAASELGDWELAKSYEDDAAELLKMVKESGDIKGTMVLGGVVAHMRGVRLAIQGDYAAAEEHLRKADERLTYAEAGTSLYKLFNRMILVETLLAEGKDTEAHQLLASARSVNPAMVEEFEESGFKVLGLTRG